MSTVIFKNLDLLDSRSVEQAVGILWAAHRHAKQSVEMFGESEADVRERLAASRAFTLLDPNTETMVNEDGTEVLSPPPTKMHAQGFYRGNTRDLVAAMLARIDKHGSTTLEDTATDMGIPLDTARAFLRNAGRTDRAHGTELPFAPRWNADKGYNEYFAR